MRSIAARFSLMPRDERLFLRMVMLAMVAHALFLAVANLMPNSAVKEVNVHTLNFRLGDGGTIKRDEPPARLPAPEVKKEAPPKPAPKVTPKAPAPKPQAAKPKEQKRVTITAPAAPSAEPEMRRVPAENAAASLAAPEEPVRHTRSYGLPSLESLFGQVEKETENKTDPSIGDLTEVAAKSAGAAGGTLNAEEAKAIRIRYEQQISGWVAKHRFYPAEAGGRHGRAVVRVRIDRQGYVRYYSIDETSGYGVFDRAAIDMIRRASPMPSAPMNYPAGNLIEFLIPITFKP